MHGSNTKGWRHNPDHNHVIFRFLMGAVLMCCTHVALLHYAVGAPLLGTPLFDNDDADGTSARTDLAPHVSRWTVPELYVLVGTSVISVVLETLPVFPAPISGAYELVCTRCPSWIRTIASSVATEWLNQHTFAHALTHLVGVHAVLILYKRASDVSAERGVEAKDRIKEVYHASPMFHNVILAPCLQWLMQSDWFHRCIWNPCMQQLLNTGYGNEALWSFLLNYVIKQSGMHLISFLMRAFEDRIPFLYSEDLRHCLRGLAPVVAMYSVGYTVFACDSVLHWNSVAALAVSAVVFTTMHAADSGTVLPMDIVSCTRQITKMTWRLLWTCMQILINQLTFNQEAGEEVPMKYELLSPALWTAAAVFVSVYMPMHTNTVCLMLIPIAVFIAVLTVHKTQNCKSMSDADYQLLNQIISSLIILAWTAWNTMVFAVTLLLLHHYGMGLVYLTLLVIGLFLFNMVNQKIFAPVEPALLQVANGPCTRHGAVKKTRSARTEAIILSWDTIMKIGSFMVFLYAAWLVTHTALDNKSFVKVVANVWFSTYTSSANLWSINTTACYSATYDAPQCDRSMNTFGCVQTVTVLKPFIGDEYTNQLGNLCYVTKQEWDIFFGRNEDKLKDRHTQNVFNMWEYMTTTFPGWYESFTKLQTSVTTTYAKCTMANIKSVTIADILAFILDIPLAFLYGTVQVMESLIMQIRPQ